MSSHEWAKQDGDVVVVGISDHAQSELGDVVYVELPEVGADVEKDKTFGVVESVKTASDVYSPVTGKVVAINENLKSQPELVNKGAFADGWMLKVTPSDPSELSSLLDAAAYKAHCEAGG